MARFSSTQLDAIRTALSIEADCLEALDSSSFPKLSKTDLLSIARDLLGIDLRGGWSRLRVDELRNALARFIFAIEEESITSVHALQGYASDSAKLATREDVTRILLDLRSIRSESPVGTTSDSIHEQEHCRYCDCPRQYVDGMCEDCYGVEESDAETYAHFIPEESKEEKIDRSSLLEGSPFVDKVETCSCGSRAYVIDGYCVFCRDCEDELNEIIENEAEVDNEASILDPIEIPEDGEDVTEDHRRILDGASWDLYRSEEEVSDFFSDREEEIEALNATLDEAPRYVRPHIFCGWDYAKDRQPVAVEDLLDQRVISPIEVEISLESLHAAKSLARYLRKTYRGTAVVTREAGSSVVYIRATTEAGLVAA